MESNWTFRIWFKAHLLFTLRQIASNSFRGNSQDNAPCESAFSRIKNEIIDIIARCVDVATVKELIDGYVNNYNIIITDSVLRCVFEELVWDEW